MTPTRPPIVAMAVATGLATANIYYVQPILGLLEADLREGRTVDLVPSAAQLGYAVGILTLVPLGDHVDRRRLILLQCAGLVGALLLAASVPTAWWLVAASAMVGVFASVAQQIVPFAAELSAPGIRGRMIGTVMSGLVVGILAARVVSGVVGERFGWRAVFVMAAGLTVLMAGLLAGRLPHSRPAARMPYLRLLGSLRHLVMSEPELRRATATQGLLFAAFSAFWTILALYLQRPAFGLGSGAAGMFGLLAVGGVAVAPLAGRFADHRGPRGVVRLGAAAVLIGFMVMVAHVGLATIAVGIVVMDAGIQMSLIGNQAIIYALAGEARGRFNTVFITGIFVLGAAGSAAASLAWDLGGWSAVTGLAIAFTVAALLIQSFGTRPMRERPRGSVPVTRTPHDDRKAS